MMPAELSQHILEGGALLVLCWLVLRSQAELRDALSRQSDAIMELTHVVLARQRGEDV